MAAGGIRALSGKHVVLCVSRSVGLMLSNNRTRNATPNACLHKTAAQLHKTAVDDSFEPATKNSICSDSRGSCPRCWRPWRILVLIKRRLGDIHIIFCVRHGGMKPQVIFK